MFFWESNFDEKTEGHLHGLNDENYKIIFHLTMKFLVGDKSNVR